MKDIIIVGGGTSGYSAALILKTRFPLINIKVIKSDKIGIIGVGESTHHFGEFTDFVGLDRLDYFKECDATVKYGVYFKDWGSLDFLHSTNINSEIQRGQFRAFYAHCLLNDIDAKNMTDKFKWSNLICQKESNNEFHFNTFKLNIFLEKKCLERGIEIITDEITEVNIENNNIKNLNHKYSADFYLDCSGFKKVLISKLGAKWISYQDYLPCNEAIAFQTPDTDEYNSYTLSQAMKCGWMWRIPVWGRWGNGYVFDNTLIDADQAKQEVETYLGHEIQIAKNIKFEAGALDQFWIGNCCAIGLASSFVEPLESSAIAATHMQTFLLLNYLINYNEENQMAYNEKTKAMMENVRDFIIMHYITDKEGVFWKKAKHLPRPSSLQFNLNMWKNRLPIRSDFGDYKVYFEMNWIPLLIAKGLIDKNKVIKEYKLMGEELIKNVKKEIVLNQPKNLIKHKYFLNCIRSNLFKIKEDKELNYTIYSDQNIVLNNDLYIKSCMDAKERFNYYFKDLDETWNYRKYNIFSLTSGCPYFYKLQNNITDIVRNFLKTKDPLWMQAWLNYNETNKFEDWHNHEESTCHGYVSIQPGLSKTIFENYEINNEIGQIYIGPSLNKHKVEYTGDFAHPRITVGFDVFTNLDFLDMKEKYRNNINLGMISI